MSQPRKLDLFFDAFMAAKQSSHFCSGTAKKQEKKFHTNKTSGLCNSLKRHMERGISLIILLLYSVINRKTFPFQSTNCDNLTHLFSRAIINFTKEHRRLEKITSNCRPMQGCCTRCIRLLFVTYPKHKT